MIKERTELTNDEIIEAYQRALTLNPQYAGGQVAQPKPNKTNLIQKKKKIAQAKKAGKSIKGSTSTIEESAPKTTREAVELAMKEHGSIA